MNAETSGYENTLSDGVAESSGPKESLIIPVIEERITVGKKIVETGKVTISKKVTQQEEIINVPVMQEEIQVERISVNRFVDEAPQVRYEGETMIVSVVREVVVVEKRLELIEELHITKRQYHSQVSEQVTLRSEEITVERRPLENLTPLSGV